MKKLSTVITALATLMLVTACQTTTDPREGGLFSYSPKAYEKRQEERKSRLGQLKDEQQEHQAENESLSKSVADQKAKHAALNKKISGLNKEINSYKAANKAQQNKLNQLRSRQASLQKRANAVSGSSMSTAQKEAEAAKLQKDVDRLTNEFNSLSML
ncbi:hypothetical protein LJC46_04720 [Desulfovibrio sp. OttesenSCG-928-G15]|nr:hypothetical protein [Desulfovibrio sp. OttesenSCG-928-G15]